MLADFTDITILLDASGSMLATSDLTRGSLVNFIKEQQALPGACNLTLVEFHTPEHFVYLTKNQPVTSFEADKLRYIPKGGSTALRQAWDRLIDERGQYFASLPETARPNKVVFVVITDGFDNSSRFVTQAQVAAKVKHQEEAYKWEFVYLAANQDAMTEGVSYGVKQGSTLTYAPEVIECSTKSLSNYVSTYRSTGAVNSFTEEDRKKAKGEK